MKVMFTPDGIRIRDVPLILIVREAFGVEDDRIKGGPGWAKTERFDIDAKVAPGDVPKLRALNSDQQRRMLVSLLEERCGLKFHHELRNLPYYELVVAKGGAKMRASKPDEPGSERADNHSLKFHGIGHLVSVGTGTSQLARYLSTLFQETVVDKTGLKGNFDYKLDWTPEELGLPLTKGADAAQGASGRQAADAGPSLFTALEVELGLKLEARKGPVDVFVVDELERPSAN